MKKILSYFPQNKEIAIVGLILLVLLMMIIPLPTAVMDFIIAFNITVTVIVLMVVIYMTSPLSLTAFPNILLVLALLRIGITVSTSRLILLEGDAGEIVSTFGEFVVGGNLVVGIIIFVIITIVNFIVITKGSERVAEVAARFSLDAMPGKQMSIDSDLRAGNITMEQASQKRSDLGLESKLFGAMDGAMKFVKGDVIASIIDILINMVGGIVIGVVQKNMAFGDALHTYTLLTIGDGLVQQVPALLISLTAGMMITRVSDDNEENNLGENILTQVFSNYKALFAASGLLLVMAFIPGMPTFTFVILLAAIIIIGIFVRKRLSSGKTPGDTSSEATIEDLTPNKNMPDVNFMQLSPLMLYLSSNLKNSNNNKIIKKVLAEIRQEVMLELGVIIPQIIIKYNTGFVDNQYQLLVYEVPVVTAKFNWNSILLLDDKPQYLDALDIQKPIKNTISFGSNDLGIWISREKEKECQEYKLRYLTVEQFLLLHFKYKLKAYIIDFLGMQEVKALLDKMTDYQDLIRELLRMLPLNKITEILQRLVAEGISIRNFKVILDSALEWAQREKEVIIITEYIRKALGCNIAYTFSNGSYNFPAILLAPDLSDAVRDGIRYSNSGAYLSIDPQIKIQIIKQAQIILEENPGVINPIIITQLDIRRYVRSIIEKDLDFLPVLSFEELNEHAELTNIGVIDIELDDMYDSDDDDEDDDD